MGNCLVTKLKVEVDNPNLPVFHYPEDRHKVSENAAIVSGDTWKVRDENSGYFIEAKSGDIITITPDAISGTRNSFCVAFTSSNTVVPNAAVSYANNTSARIIQEGESSLQVIENCYLWVLELMYQSGNIENWKPTSIKINGYTLQDNGWLI